jgi:hypothetical protein
VLIPAQRKLCPQCQQEKPLDQFYVHKDTGEATSWCKACCRYHAKRHREQRKANGVCVRCHQPARPGKMTCAEHIYATIHAEARAHEAIIAKDALTRVCEVCRQTLPTNQFPTRHYPSLGTAIFINGPCKKCRIAARNKATRALRLRHKITGLCTRCETPAVEGKTLCEYHAAQWKKAWAARDVAAEDARKSIYRKKALDSQFWKAQEYKNQRNARRKRERQEKYSAAILDNMRRRVNKAIRDKYAGFVRKGGRTTELIGCSIVDLMTHLEKQFMRGMSWENYGYRGWHIDHIRPCAKFDLTDPEQQKACFHFTNLRPLWAADNHAKHAKAELLL